MFEMDKDNPLPLKCQSIDQPICNREDTENATITKTDPDNDSNFEMN